MKHDRDDLVPLLKLTDLSTERIKHRIPDLLTMSGNVLISAYRKAGKTSLILDLIGALTQGTDFLGSLPCQQLDGPVVYVNIELEQAMLRDYCETMGIDIKRNEDMLILDYCGRASKFDIASEDFIFKIGKQLRSVEARALVIDPIHPLIALQGGDSNSNDEARAVMEQLAEIRYEAELDHLFIVDHTGHMDKSRARGASGKEDWADILWNITSADTRGRTLSAVGRGVSQHSLTYEQAGDGHLRVTKAGATTPDTPKDNEAVILRVMLGKDWMTVAEIMADTSLQQSSVQYVLDKLERMGNVESRKASGVRAIQWRRPQNF